MLRLVNVLLSFTVFAGVMACCCPCPIMRGGGPPININVPPPQPVNPGDGLAKNKQEQPNKSKDDPGKKKDDNKVPPIDDAPIPVTPEAMLKKFPFGGVGYTYRQSTGEFKLLDKQVLGKGVGGFPPGQYTIARKERNVQPGGLFSVPRDHIQLSPPPGQKGFFFIMPDDIQYNGGNVIRLPRNVWEAIVGHGKSVVDVLP